MTVSFSLPIKQWSATVEPPHSMMRRRRACMGHEGGGRCAHEQPQL